jgi:hypothetical protein
MFEISYARFSLAQILSVSFGVGSRNTAGLKGVDDYPDKE